MNFVTTERHLHRLEQEANKIGWTITTGDGVLGPDLALTPKAQTCPPTVYYIAGVDNWPERVQSWLNYLANR